MVECRASSWALRGVDRRTLVDLTRFVDRLLASRSTLLGDEFPLEVDGQQVTERRVPSMRVVPSRKRNGAVLASACDLSGPWLSSSFSSVAKNVSAMALS